MKIINNKIYNCTNDCIMLSKLKAKWIEVAKNDILKNNGNGIRLVCVKNITNDPAKVNIRNNSISESYCSYGIMVENSSVTLEHNEIRKN